MNKRKTISVVAAAALALGLTVAVGAPAQAYTTGYGNANCYSQYPSLMSRGVGTMTHNIEDGVSGGYYTRTFYNGAATQTHMYQRQEAGYSANANLVATDYWAQGSWYCAVKTASY